MQEGKLGSSKASIETRPLKNTVLKKREKTPIWQICRIYFWVKIKTKDINTNISRNYFNNSLALNSIKSMCSKESFEENISYGKKSTDLTGPNVV